MKEDWQDKIAIGEEHATGEKEDSTEEFSFIWFTRHPFYKEVNRLLVDGIGLVPGQTVVDLACGTGAVTRLIADKIRGAKESAIIGIDASSSAVKQARQELESAGSSIIRFVEARAEHLGSVVGHQVDAIIFCNAIHMVSNKSQVISEISKVLHPGGKFAFNSAFFQGSNPPETEQFYRRWMMKALRTLKWDYNMSPEHGSRVMARKPLTVEEYRTLLEEQGLRIEIEEVRPVPMTLQGWIDISRFEDFVAGTLPGVPIREASAAMRKAVQDTFDEMKLTIVPRNWLQVIAVKKA